MPFVWSTAPQLPSPPIPESIPSNATSYKVDVVANTVNAGGQLLYNTSTKSYDVVYEFDKLNVNTLVARTLNSSTSNITTLNLISGTIQTNANSNLEIVNFGSRGGSGGGFANIQNVFPILYQPSNGLLSLATFNVGSELLTSNTPNGSILISNTVSGKFDNRQINAHPSIYLSNTKGYLSIAAAGHPVLSGPRYGSSWQNRLTQGAPIGNFTGIKFVWTGSNFICIGTNTSNNEPAIAISSDATSWSVTTYTGQLPFTDIIWSGSTLLTLAQNSTTCHVRTSSDGITWNLSTTPAGLWKFGVWTGSLFMVATVVGAIMTSPDGITWTSRTALVASALWAAMASDTLSVVVVGGSSGIAQSFDSGVTWNYRASDPSVTNSFDDILFANGKYVATSSSSTPATKCVQVSSNGVSWLASTTPNIYKKVGFNKGNYFLCDGPDGTLQVSIDAVTWSNVALPVSIPNLTFIGGNPSTNLGVRNLFGSTIIAISPDTTNWTLSTINQASKVPIAWNGNIAIATTYNQTYYSNNAIVWNPISSQSGNWVSSAWNGNVFVVLERANVVQISANGLSWNLYSTGISGTFNDLTVVGNTFVAVGNSGSVMVGNSTGTGWTSQSAPNSDWQSVTYNGNSLVSVGLNNAIMTSPNGNTWIAQTGPAGSTNWYSVAWGSNKFVAVGNSGAVMASYDSIEWTMVSSNTTIDWIGVGWNGSVFSAVGNNSVMTSPDGLNWTVRNNIPTGYWQEMLWAANVFISTSRSGPNPQNVIMTTEPEDVLSVAGKTGAVLLNTNDVSENAAGPYYFTAARVRGNVGATSPLGYDSSTGTFSHLDSGATSGTYGGGANIPSMVVSAKGHITSISNTTISIPTNVITSGILSVSRGGTGKDATGLVNGSLLIGNTVNSGFDLATLSVTSPISIVNGKGSIQLSHAVSGVTTGTYGNSTIIPSITIDDKGHITNVVNVAVTSIPSANADGSLLIGNSISSLFQQSLLTPGTGIVITNAPGSITIAATGGSAIDQFARDTANGAFVTANAAFVQANAAYNQANSAYNQANGAFNKANAAVANSGVTVNGSLLIGNTISGGFDLNTLTQGSGIVITTSNGTISISANGGSGIDQFARDTANGAFAAANAISANVTIPSYAQISSNTNQHPANTNAVVINFDTNNSLANVTHAIGDTRCTITSNGLYHISFTVRADGGSASTPETAQYWFRKNGVDVANSSVSLTLTNGVISVVTSKSVFNLIANDYIEVVQSVSNSTINMGISRSDSSVGPTNPSAILTVAKIQSAVSGGGGGGGSSSTFGTATLDFGAAPGTTSANVTVTGQTALTSNSYIQVFIQGTDATADHTAFEHGFISSYLKPFVQNIVAGSSFNIEAHSAIRLTGQITVRWRYD